NQSVHFRSFSSCIAIAPLPSNWGEWFHRLALLAVSRLRTPSRGYAVRTRFSGGLLGRSDFGSYHGNLAMARYQQPGVHRVHVCHLLRSQRIVNSAVAGCARESASPSRRHGMPGAVRTRGGEPLHPWMSALLRKRTNSQTSRLSRFVPIAS